MLESIRRGLWSGVTGLFGMLNWGVKFEINDCEDADSTRACRIFPPSAPGDVVGDVDDGIRVGLATLDMEYIFFFLVVVCFFPFFLFPPFFFLSLFPFSFLFDFFACNFFTLSQALLF